MNVNLTIKSQTTAVGTLVLMPTGQITAATIGELEKRLQQETVAPLKAVVLDCAGVTIIDSSGIGLILRTRKKLGQRGIGYAVIHLTPAIRKVFEIVHLAPHLNLFSNQAELDDYLLALQKTINPVPPGPG
jgi:anti-anti-sigma factor